MSYDLVIKNGKIIDGSGLPGFHGDVAVCGGRIVEIGRVNGGAHRIVDADGLVVAPGIVDNHTHYDAQVTWDPLCTYSCYHAEHQTQFIQSSRRRCRTLDRNRAQ